MKCGKKINTFRVTFALVWSGQEVKPQCVSNTALILNPDTALPQLLGGELTLSKPRSEQGVTVIYTACVQTPASLFCCLWSSTKPDTARVLLPGWPCSSLNFPSQVKLLQSLLWLVRLLSVMPFKDVNEVTG